MVLGNYFYLISHFLPGYMVLTNHNSYKCLKIFFQIYNKDVILFVKKFSNISDITIFWNSTLLMMIEW